jgi:hypothetical protein
MTAGGYGSGGYGSGGYGPGGSGYGPIRATDADRESVRAILQEAHTQGRLDWTEFEARSTAVMNAQTYDQLASLTADLTNRIPGSPPQVYQNYPGGMQGRTNGMAIASLICGIAQFFVPFFCAIAAIITGHVARRQIRQTGEQGAGMAVAGMVLGYAGLVLSIIGIIVFVVLIVAVAHSTQLPPSPNFNIGGQ